jgi:magnesium transporter
MTNREQLHEELRRLAEAEDAAGFAARARDVHPSDVSDVLAGLDEDVRLRLLRRLPPEIVSEALAEMDEEEHPEELLAALGPERAADILEELEDDDAADLVAELPPEAVARILSGVDDEDRADIERLLEYDEESAGGRMTSSMVAVPASATAAEAIAEIRRQAEEMEDFYQVYCFDERHRLVGILPLQRLVVAKPQTLVREIMDPPPVTATPEMDQEEVARLMARYNVPAIAVVDPQRKLLGRITFDDVIDVVEAETTEDLLRFGGIPGEEQLAGDWRQSIRSRLPWLYVNLLTAFLAGAVVYFFQGTIVKIVALAVWMPIIAGMGGNAGTQALAVTARRIALGMIPVGQGLKLVGKELLVGLVNGFAIGVVVVVVATLMGHTWLLGAVVMMAMWGNQIVATVAGAAIPLGLDRIGVDPAVASSVFVTTLTDICGFVLLLGLGTILLLP